MSYNIEADGSLTSVHLRHIDPVFFFTFLLSINQIDECHISQDQTQKINFLRDPLLEDRFIHLFNKNIYDYFKVNKQNKI